MRCLGFDLGSKTLGISISDTTNTIASLYDTIRFKDEDYLTLAKNVSKIIIDNKIDTIVLGLPKNMNNTITTRGEITLEFKKTLECIYPNIKVELEDERLTSVISNNILIASGMRREKRKKKVDGMAAIIILQSYLDKFNNQYLQK